MGLYYSAAAATLGNLYAGEVAGLDPSTLREYVRMTNEVQIAMLQKQLYASDMCFLCFQSVTPFQKPVPGFARREEENKTRVFKEQTYCADVSVTEQLFFCFFLLFFVRCVTHKYDARVPANQHFFVRELLVPNLYSARLTCVTFFFLHSSGASSASGVQYAWKSSCTATPSS